MTVDEYTNIDKTFNRSLFVGKINQMLNNIYEAISNNDIEAIHSYMSDDVFQKIKRKIDHNTKDNMTLKFENVSIDTEIYSFDSKDDLPIIKVSSTCKYAKNYYLDNKIQKEISIDKMSIVHKFSICKKNNTDSFYKCDNCGVSYDIFESKKCPYCGNAFIYEPSDYIIIEMEY